MNDITEFLGRLGDMVRDKSVAILGSAPGAFEIPRDVEIIASVNGSHASFGLREVDIHILNSHSQYHSTEVQIAVQAAIEGLRCKVSIYIDAANRQNPPENFSDFQISIPKSDRHALYSWALEREIPQQDDGDALPSTGIAAAMILRRLGAHVSLVGFSLQDGHSLVPSAQRMHTNADAEFMPLFS